MRIARTGILPLIGAAALAGCSGTSEAEGEARWTSGSIEDLREAIGERAEHGLDRVRFEVPEDAGSAAGQTAMTKAALLYASALARGASDPGELYEVYTVPRNDPDLKAGLAKALAEGDVDDWLDSLAPHDGAYEALSKAYLALADKKAAPSPEIPVPEEPLEAGDEDPRVPAIARQLAASGYLSGAVGRAAGQRYSEEMVAAVKRMQADYGIDPDGIIGKDALEILNFSDADRARALAVAMERLRWLERKAPDTRIDVNTATGRLTYWREGKVADRRKAVVGEPGHETPQLGSPIYRLVANPTWTVPRSIEENELAGKGAAYLRANNMARKDGWIVQQSGPENSLGLVKFDMKNDHAIYLHDTPAKALFDEVQRQRSHGCVRVEDALGFAALIASHAGLSEEWTAARETGEETFVALPREIPVRLLYQTVVLDEEGTPSVHADPYDWDTRVARKLGFGERARHVLKAGAQDVGP
ncbi:L,D-transpeptidase family protein [Novosphingobium mangrovi (ex Hu et al. 2023)]|uniref:L,D-transpeptidase family protein n=1 Tax=Novosphingobium mangrovi (ex Hu et al. 2023) TaxID=2930094 RepID=UPI003AF28499